ncbi:MAG: hypothetical protein KBA26_12225 [Candidatus Delongbacteria bacterium]|nr:hypothetical protein [Candidatus Delongbacteria bacterium]
MVRVLALGLFLMIIGACGHDEEQETLCLPQLQRIILDDYHVTDIAFSSDGTAWIATFKKGLIRYQAGQITIFNSDNSVVSDSTSVRCLETDSRDNLWIGTNHGLIRFDGIKFTRYHSRNSPMPIDLVLALAIDHQDKVWAAVCRFNEGGLVQFDGNEWKVYTPENSSLPIHLLGDLEVDHNNHLWIAAGSRLIRVAGDEWKHYNVQDFGFTPFLIGKIQSNQKNELIVQIDYALSSALPFHEPVLFKFNGQECDILEVIDSAFNIPLPPGLYIDRQDHIWCNLWMNNSHHLAIHNGLQWNYLQDSLVPDMIYTIRQAPDQSVWLATAHGIYIYR